MTAAAGSRITLLGGFGLWSDAQRLALGPIESRIVALTAVHGRPLPRPNVAVTIWPRAKPAQAAARLRSALYRLQRLVPGLVRRAGAGLDLADGVRCDTRDLERWAGRVITGDGDDGWPAVGGELLPAWDDAWVVLHRERLRQLQAQALEVLTARLSVQARHDQAIAAGRTAVRLGPLRESTRRALIRALAAAGRHDEAGAEYEDFRTVLRQALGLAPSPHLEKVIAALGVLPSRGGDAAVTPGG